MKKFTVTFSVNILAWLLFSQAAQACPANPPPMLPNAVTFFERNAPITGEGPVAELVITGYSAQGSAAGDSCGVALELPDDLIPISVSIVNSDNGKSVGFGEFQNDPHATREICGNSKNNCVVFVSNVKKNGIKAETPLTMIIQAESKQSLTPTVLNDIATKITKTGVIMAGGIDEMGLPNHHFSVFRPNGIKIEFVDKNKTPLRERRKLDTVCVPSADDFDIDQCGDDLRN